MHASTDFCKKTKNLVFTITSLFILALLSIFPVAASVSDWEFSPQELVSGDTLNILGSASPGEEVDVFVSFEKTVQVSGGEFEYTLEDVKIPQGLDNAFTVEATGAENLNVRVKIGIWVTKSSEASGDMATVSQSSVPPGTYRIKIDGDAKEGVSKVKLKVTAFQGIEADSNGKFSYSYNTKAMPAGDFEIKVGGVEKTVTIEEEKSSISSSTTGSNSEEMESKKSTTTDSMSTDPTSAASSSTNSSTKSTSENQNPEEESAIEQENSSERDKVAETGIQDEKSVQENKTQLSGKNTQKTESSIISADKLYLLAGMGAGLLILIIYSRRK